MSRLFGSAQLSPVTVSWLISVLETRVIQLALVEFQSLLEAKVGEDKAPKMPYLVLKHDGTMMASNPHQLILACNLDINKFPFDSQMCEISVSLWLHTAKEVRLRFLQNPTEITKESQDLYLSSGEWNFTKINIIKENLTDVEVYPVIVYKISMERRPVLHVLNLILPTACFLSMDIFISSIPEHYDDKISFKITLILGVSVLSLILNEILPITSTNPPLIGIF
uniref:5-hydroxytryptamine receptor 3A-like n=1 Tax=Geotrypetes seraphini TaxID=260995 RepID=A0A6P8SET0_GEOSA|nr:5-hydroxytryptamine receptor 3A-like [Geotrypetes seraphini]